MGYLLGLETDFSEFEEFAKRDTERGVKEQYSWLENIKYSDRFRPEWIPEDED